MKFLPALFIFFFSSSFVQDNRDVTFISFELTHSRRISNHHVFINIINKNKRSSVHLIATSLGETKIRIYKVKDTSFTIIDEKFKEVNAAILQLQQIDTSKGIVNGIDGTNCKVEFGSANKTVKYEFWSPDYETEQRGLTDFLNACNKIIEAAHLQPKDVL